MLYKTKANTLRFFPEKGAKGLDPLLSAEHIDAVDGKFHWRPTAEIQSSMKSIQVEIIYGGEKGVPISEAAGNAATIGKEMADFWTAVNAGGRDDKATLYMVPDNILRLSKVSTSQLAAAKWKLQSSATSLSVHVTAPIPLAAVGKALAESILVTRTLGDKMPKVANISELLQIVGPIEWTKGITPDFGTRSIQGYLILICAYIKHSEASPKDLDSDLKKKTPLMPRTDFAAMLKIIGELMSPKSAAAFNASLTKLVLAAVQSELPYDLNRYLSWGRPETTSEPEPPIAGPSGSVQPTPIPPPPPKGPQPGAKPPAKLPTAATTVVLERWHVKVSDWIAQLGAGGADLVALKDLEFRGGQIGGLGSKVENLIPKVGSAPLEQGNACPIFEFRDAGTPDVTQLKEFLPTVVAEVQKLHASAL